MNIAFFYEHGQVPEIGTGHKYRCINLMKMLSKRGHSICEMSDLSEVDVLVVDHAFSQKDIMIKARNLGIKVVLLDGVPGDISFSDISISAFYNSAAEHRGPEHIIIPIPKYSWNRYGEGQDSDTVFVGMGGFDANNIAESVIGVLADMGISALVAKSINHHDFDKRFSNVKSFTESNYYTAFKKCKVSITNGGLTLFQALHYGIPTIAIPQYEHQERNISYVDHCCDSINQDNMNDLSCKVETLLSSSQYREAVSDLSQKIIDGHGARRACDMIEGLLP